MPRGSSRISYNHLVDFNQVQHTDSEGPKIIAHIAHIRSERRKFNMESISPHIVRLL